MRVIFTRTLAALLLLAVAVLTASATLRLFLHGREVMVPNLTGMSDDEAASAVKKMGLNLSVENRFYSAAVAPSHILSQSPATGSRVRRGWQVRVTESLGGQHSNVPDVLGQNERPASLILRRLQLELGPSAHLPASGPSGIVLAQSPPPNSPGLAGPHVALLLADDQTDAPQVAYVMPLLIGGSIFQANGRLAAVGLHIAAATDPTYIPPPAVVPDPNALPQDPAIPETVIPPPPVSGTAIIVSQYPLPGRKVTRTDNIRVQASQPVLAGDLPLVP